MTWQSHDVILSEPLCHLPPIVAPGVLSWALYTTVELSTNCGKGSVWLMDMSLPPTSDDVYTCHLMEQQ